jgi:hypothetical protein
MSEWIKRGLSPATLIALIALFVALGGSVYAASKIGGNKIKVNSIPPNRIKSDSLGGGQINESSLGKVPSATSADSATSALTADSAGTAANGIDGVAGGITNNTGSNVLLFSLAEGSISVFCDDVVANFKYTNNSGATAQVFDDGAFSAQANGVTDAGRKGDLMIATDDHLIHAHLQIEATGGNCPFAASFYEIAL